ncbi:MAG: hypothetical protein D6770_00935, partial [Anaerolineae bacterium]
MKTPKGFLWITIIIALAGIVVLCLGAALWSASRPGGEKPTIQVLQPQPDAPLYAHVPVSVQATASGQHRPIRWLRFYVDTLLSGEQMGPQTQLIGTWTWTPASPGLHTLAFVAANDQGERDMVTLTVTVLPAADRDGDNVPDEQDSCPDQAGAAINQGCPVANDSDADGLPDEQDACPQEAGRPEERGCPLDAIPDQDGDGVADWDDHCPSEAGQPEQNGCPTLAWFADSDADGLTDVADSCPQQPGPAANNGCPVQQPSDRDGDGVPDDQDTCPDQGGSPQNGGCPLTEDGDGDGVPDAQDQCPDQAGWLQVNGCLPDDWFVDHDLDHVPDRIDSCTDRWGPIPLLGCPDPNDDDGDGVSNAQDQCPNRSGLPWNVGCPDERLAIGRENRFCDLAPFLCPRSFTDVDCNAHPEACGLDTGCPQDADCDGVPDDLDECPDRFGLGFEGNTSGCPLDWNGNGQADENDDDHDGVPNEMDSCPQAQGSLQNSGCPRPEGETVNLQVELER